MYRYIDIDIDTDINIDIDPPHTSKQAQVAAMGRRRIATTTVQCSSQFPSPLKARF